MPGDGSADYRELLLTGAPMMDVRAPIEFKKGAFPGVVNLPLMNDVERQKVGTCYKRSGQEAAIALGRQLVSGPIRAERIAAWAEFARTHPHGYLYCFRGGLRSQIAQQWLRDDTGMAYPRVFGGYKAMRGFLLDEMEQAFKKCSFIVLGGLTGSGKTEVLGELSNRLDLEDHAHHRGSSFGGHVDGQPAQIDFENTLAVDLLRKRAAGHDRLVVEDESRIVGSCSLPLALYARMQSCPMVWLEDRLENRVRRILDAYVVDLHAEFCRRLGGDAGFEPFAARLRRSMANIAKRLGGERYQRLSALMEAALQAQRLRGNVETHCAWIEGLLTEYYDPMYGYQRKLKASRTIFAGDAAAVRDYLRQCSA